MAQQFLSPLVQVMQTPFEVISQTQLQQAKLHWQQTMPFIVQVTQQRPPANMRQRFCSVPQATSSSQQHVILQPPAHFSILISQRGTTHQAGAPTDGVIVAGAEVTPPIMEPIPARSTIRALDIANSSSCELRQTSGTSSRRREVERKPSRIRVSNVE
jgi:hypothetical protein